jgi:hypothetical protein
MKERFDQQHMLTAGHGIFDSGTHVSEIIANVEKVCGSRGVGKRGHEDSP